MVVITDNTVILYTVSFVLPIKWITLFENADEDLAELFRRRGRCTHLTARVLLGERITINRDINR